MKNSKISSHMADILIIDDSPAVIHALESILVDEGHAVTSAPNGMDGLQKAFAQDFGLVITDLNMPKMGGIEFVRLLRSKKPKVPVFFLTTEGSVEAAQQAKAVGANGWITKPFQAPRLKALINRVL